MDKSQELYESLKKLEPMELITKKTVAIKELDKLVKMVSEAKIDKGAERLKLEKVVEKLSDQLLHIKVVDKLLKEKDF